MNSNRFGQTLLESLVAIGIIAIGVVSIISLLISLNRTSTSTLNQSVATQLAAEGLEAVHYVRDSNWLKTENGETRPYYDRLRSSSRDYSAIYVWDPTSGILPDNAITVAALPEADLTGNKTIVYQDTTGYYRQVDNVIAPDGWTATKYRRWLTLYPVCRDTTATIAILNTTEQIMTQNNSDCSTEFGSSYIEVGIQARVTVQWPEPSRTASYVIEEILYDWKYAQ